MKYSNEKIELLLQNFGGESQIRRTLKARLLSGAGAAGSSLPRRLAWGAALSIFAAAAAVFFISKAAVEESPYAVINPAALDYSLRGRFTMPQEEAGPLIIDDSLIDDTKLLIS